MLLSTSNLKLRGYNSKLMPRHIGPYEIVELIGNNAARLKLPESSKLHDVFNVSLLK